MILRFRLFLTTMLVLLVGVLPLESLNISNPAKCHAMQSSLNNSHNASDRHHVSTSLESNSLVSTCQHCDNCIVSPAVGLIVYTTTNHKITSFYSQFAMTDFTFKSFILDIPHPPPQSV